MSRSFGTTPIRILIDRGIRFKKHYVKKEYSFGKCAASGPGGLDCLCCFPHMGSIRNSKDKPKMRRYIRRISKLNINKDN